MRERVRDLGRLEHMLEHIDRANQFMDGKSLADLEKDAMLRYAVVKCRVPAYIILYHENEKKKVKEFDFWKKYAILYCPGTLRVLIQCPAPLGHTACADSVSGSARTHCVC